MRLASVCALFALVATLASGAGGAYDQRIYIPTSCSRYVAFKYRPRALCVGNGGLFRRLTWDAYGGRRALAHGQTFHNDCVPDCAEGTGSWVATRISVFRVRWACGKRIYTRLTGVPPWPAPFRLWVPGADRCPR